MPPKQGSLPRQWEGLADPETGEQTLAGGSDEFVKDQRPLGMAGVLIA